MQNIPKTWKEKDGRSVMYESERFAKIGPSARAKTHIAE
jgi:hypothetical protein